MHVRQRIRSIGKDGKPRYAINGTKLTTTLHELFVNGYFYDRETVEPYIPVCVECPEEIPSDGDERSDDVEEVVSKANG